MTGYRKNSFVIDFSVMPVRPKLNVVQDFVFSKMMLDMSQVKNLQTSITKSQVIIEMDSAATAESIIAQHSLKHSLEHENQLYPIPVHPVDNAIEVKVYDLPPHMPNNIIASQFAAFGRIISVRNDVWKDYFPGVPNGVRVIRMEVQKPIPSYVLVSGELSYVLHANQVKTCRHCGQKIHVGKSCSAARKETATNVSGSPTLAEIVGNNRISTNENEFVEIASDTTVEDSNDESDPLESAKTEEPTENNSSKSSSKPAEVPTSQNGVLPKPSTSKPTTTNNEAEVDPLGGRKRPISPKQSEQDLRNQRKLKSQRQLSK